MSFCGLRLPFALVFAAVFLPSSAHAQPPSRAPSPATSGATSTVSTKDAADAQLHFKRARELYQQGLYRDALNELEAAHTLDPEAKDLVFNLSLVTEKLSRIDDALRYMRMYSEMNLDSAERARAESSIRRLEGVKRATPEVVPVPVAPPTPPPPQEPPPARGRIDVWTLTAATVAVGGFAVGTIFGLKATSDKPAAGFTTGPGGMSFGDVQAKQNSAHSEAVLADIGFAVGIAATVTTAVLYFARNKKPHHAEPASGKASVSAGVTPHLHGGGVFIGGTF
ncbi:MAG: tetratricopeptide repeat protein [Polyangiaceae bacterium]